MPNSTTYDANKTAAAAAPAPTAPAAISYDANKTAELQELLNDISNREYEFDSDLPGLFEKAVELIEQKADPNITDKDGNTILDFAIENRITEIISPLLLNGAKANANKGTPLHIATGIGDIKIARFLLDNGANVNEIGGKNTLIADMGIIAEKCHAIHIATKIGDIKMVGFLLDNGADVNAESHQNKLTPLHIAATNHYADIVTLLISRGANVNPVSDGKLTPLELVHKSASKTANETHDCLRKSGAKIRSELLNPEGYKAAPAPAPTAAAPTQEQETDNSKKTGFSPFFLFLIFTGISAAIALSYHTYHSIGGTQAENDINSGKTPGSDFVSRLAAAAVDNLFRRN